MLQIRLPKIDRFIIILALVLFFSSIVIIVTTRAIFSAYITSQEIDEESFSKEPHINVIKLDEAYDALGNIKHTSLDLKL